MAVRARAGGPALRAGTPAGDSARAGAAPGARADAVRRPVLWGPRLHTAARCGPGRRAAPRPARADPTDAALPPRGGSRRELVAGAGDRGPATGGLAAP